MLVECRGECLIEGIHPLSPEELNALRMGVRRVGGYIGGYIRTKVEGFGLIAGVGSINTISRSETNEAFQNILLVTAGLVAIAAIGLYIRGGQRNNRRNDIEIAELLRQQTQAAALNALDARIASAADKVSNLERVVPVLIDNLRQEPDDQDGDNKPPDNNGSVGANIPQPPHSPSGDTQLSLVDNTAVVPAEPEPELVLATRR